jgi:predicted ribosomally synthesized peptide with nif11-like leader
MSLDAAKNWVRWIDQSENADSREKVLAMSSTAEKLALAKSLGFDFTVEEHDQAYLDYAKSVVELSDEQLEAAAGGIGIGNFDASKLPVHTVYAVFPFPNLGLTNN